MILEPRVFNQEECIQECRYANYDYVLYSNDQSYKNPRCVCVLYCDLEENFQVYPQDISADCGAMDSRCPYGKSESYSLFCKLGSACSAIQNFMFDDAWFGPDTDAFKPWMNDFPKCISEEDVREKFLTNTITIGPNQKIIPEICFAQAPSNAKYILINKNLDGRYQCSYSKTSLAFQSSDGDATINQKNCDVCTSVAQLSPFPPYKTCGSRNSYSVYCNDDECKVTEQDGQYLHYFGCSAQPHFPLTPNGLYFQNLKNMQECLDACISNIFELDISIIVTTLFNDLMQCHCYENSTTSDLNIRLENLTHECVQEWSPDVPSLPVGNFLENDRRQVFGIHCERDACIGLVTSPVFPSPIHKCPCGIEICDITNSTTEQTSSTSTTTITTESTTTSTSTSTRTSTITSTTFPAICFEKCDERTDERGFIWNATCVGTSIELESHCPNDTSGKHIRFGKSFFIKIVIICLWSELEVIHNSS